MQYHVKIQNTGALEVFEAKTDRGAKIKASQWQGHSDWHHPMMLYKDLSWRRDLVPVARKESGKWTDI